LLEDAAASPDPTPLVGQLRTRWKDYIEDSMEPLGASTTV